MIVHRISSAVAVAFALLSGAPLCAQSANAAPYVATGLFIGAIEEGARIFTPARLLPFEHPESLGHQFPTAFQLHGGEDRLLVLLGAHAGLRLKATLQRYPTEPDTLWPYAPLRPPPVDRFDKVSPINRPRDAAPLPGLRAVAFLDGFPLAFIVDTRGLTLAERHMQQATTMGLDLTRAEFLDALAVASQAVPANGAAILVYQR
jgi:hypothetical protein